MTKRKEYTEKEFWEEYWNNKKIEPLEGVFFRKYLKLLPIKASLIDIGGFPGLFASFFKKNFGYNVTLLDYIIDKEVINKVEKLHGFKKDSINIIESDFFKYKSPIKYDVVTSFGFIEHFEDTFEQIKLHRDLLKDGGTLFLTVPNFAGLNGWVNKFFHAENYNACNIKAMNVKYIHSIMTKLGFKKIIVEHFGPYGLWLEPHAPVSDYTRKIVSKFSMRLKSISPKPNSFLSTQIFIYGIK